MFQGNDFNRNVSIYKTVFYFTHQCTHTLIQYLHHIYLFTAFVAVDSFNVKKLQILRILRNALILTHDY